jgi:aqualysin 1
MRTPLLISVTMLIGMFASAFAQNDAPLHLQSAIRGRPIPGRYIVVLTDGTNARAVAQRHGVAPTFIYTSALNGFAAALSRGQLQRLRRDADVRYIDEDGVVQADWTDGGLPSSQEREAGGDVVQTGATWGLDKLDQEWGGGLDGNYNYVERGLGVNVYVVDTGIRVTHNEFDGTAANRAKAGAMGFDAFGGNGVDCNGHGTHIAGTIGGTTYGVAKAVKLYSVRVLDCSGSGTWANFIAGVEWITANHVKPAVANASLGGPYVQAANDAVSKSVSWGVTWVVPSGGSNTDACNFSPGSTAAAITVGATDSSNAKAAFSNHGPCVDVHAPGVNITSAWITSDAATATLSGTSMSSSHVAGLAALYAGVNKTAAPGQITDAVTNSAVNGAITGLPSGTANLLAHKLNGNLSGTGEQLQEPDVINGQNYYWSNNAGYHHVWLRGTPGTNYNIEFYKWNGTVWVKVAQKVTSSTNEYLKYHGSGAAYYMYLVKSAAGSGTYDSWLSRPA